MKNLRFQLLSGLFALTVSLVSCSKEEDVKGSSDVDQKMMMASAEIDFVNEADFNSGMEVASDNGSYSGKNSSHTAALTACATVTVNNITPGVFPKVFTINFGNGCINNGIHRSGILTITLSDYLMNTGSVMTIERSNYYVNGRHVEGTVTYENETTNPDTPQWTRTITNGQITNLQGEVFTHHGTRTVKQTEGVGTLTLDDNVYHILSGTHTVNRPNGTSLTVTVVETLIKKYACNYISQGQLDLEGTYLDGILDYGDNTCDNQATYTHSNGTVYPVNL
ncbi:hypothetical protein [Flavobacterium suncheonense]|uniref:Lipoprotein n=1 Tax=Flavobacterium suncheonense GH29-5 = DSM 17707 TaxID=1121899 RepID=A0A0A2MFS2_9FLAO|nr:hypothetical protein [Flavobacterium suncheonense]KGO90288.1 hypothetical protein Q764_04350 [Flavobacterium suncheonense GH29-5 = DSM 17707]